jgi:hypothetical protein
MEIQMWGGIRAYLSTSSLHVNASNLQPHVETLYLWVYWGSCLHRFIHLLDQMLS